MAPDTKIRTPSFIRVRRRWDVPKFIPKTILEMRKAPRSSINHTKTSMRAKGRSLLKFDRLV